MSDDQFLYDNIERNDEYLNLPRWQLDMGKELMKFKLALLGMVRNELYGLKNNDGFIDVREFVPLNGANLVNERGATAIHNKLSSELTKIPSDSKFDTHVIGTELVAFDIDFSEWLAVNHEDFELSDKDYNTICESAIRLVKAAWYRSLDGWKGNLINNNVQQREVINNNNQVEREKPRILGLWGR